MLILAMAVLFGSAEQPSAAAPGVKNGGADQVVCRSRARTGTRFASKTCMKRKEIDERAEEDRRALEEIQMRAKDNPPEIPPPPRS